MLRKGTDSNSSAGWWYPLILDTVADYHTHAAYDPTCDNEHFSPDDIADMTRFNRPGYLGTPGKQILFYKPEDGEWYVGKND